MKPIILAVDFDGTIHDCPRAWAGASIITGKPHEGAIEWLTKVLEECRPCLGWGAQAGVPIPSGGYASTVSRETGFGSTRGDRLYRVIIHTSRLLHADEYPEGKHFCDGTSASVRIGAIKQWLITHGLPLELVKLLHFHTGHGKPQAHLYIDDKGYHFQPRQDGAHGFEHLMAYLNRQRAEKVWE